MDVAIRDATAADAPFLAWVMQAAARSHRPICFWDLAFPGPDPQRLDYIAALAVAEPPSFMHYGGFLVAEHAGKPVAALSGYDSATKGMDTFLTNLMETVRARDWSPEHQSLLGTRMLPVTTCTPDSPPGVWIVEWVAALPEARGKGVAGRLLRAILERGRAAGYTRSQIAYLIGNAPARQAYERVGFEKVDEKRHPDFEATFGSPGIARMVRDL